MNKIGGFVRLLRPVNCVMMGFAVLVGAVLASSQFAGLDLVRIGFGFATAFTFCGAAMVINDIYDRKIDAINEPNRPIPSGTVKTGEALAFTVALYVVGFVFAFLLSLLCVLVAAVTMIITATYLTVGKRSGLPGNMLVSACVAAPFIYGSIVAFGTVPLSVWMFAIMAFLANTGREITKGIVDTKGDSAQGVKTVAVRFGEKTAAAAAGAFYLSAVALTPVTWFLGLVGIWFVPFVLVTDVGLVACTVLLLQDHTREKAKKIKNTALTLFLIALIAYIAGTIH